MPMRDIVWSKRVLDRLLQEAMFDDLTAAVAHDWARGHSVVRTSMERSISTRTVDRCRRRIRDAYDAVTVDGGLPPRKIK